MALENPIRVEARRAVGRHVEFARWYAWEMLTLPYRMILFKLELRRKNAWARRFRFDFDAGSGSTTEIATGRVWPWFQGPKYVARWHETF